MHRLDILFSVARRRLECPCMEKVLFFAIGSSTVQIIVPSVSFPGDTQQGLGSPLQASSLSHPRPWVGNANNLNISTITFPSLDIFFLVYVCINLRKLEPTSCDLQDLDPVHRICRYFQK
jgi:hypothetical protein